MHKTQFSRFRYLIIAVITYTVFSQRMLFSVDISLDGYFRTRGYTFRELDLNDDLFNTYRGFIEERFRLNSQLSLTDTISIKSQLDLLDNVVWGGNTQGSRTALNPAIYSATDSTATPEVVQDLVSSTLAFNDGQEASLIYLKRAWVEALFPVGIMRFGRQPTHFGMGIFENNGNALDGRFGNTVDRISFQTGFNHLSFGLGYDKDVEDDLASLVVSRFQATGIDTGEDDINRIFGEGGIDKEDEKLLGRISKKWGSVYDLSSWIYNVYGMVNKESLRLSGEFLSVQGHLGERELSVYNAATRVEGLFSWVEVGLENGLASGTQNGSSNTELINSVPFNRDYNISHILFEEALPGGAQADSTDPDNENVISVPPSSGAISNASYSRAFTTFKWGKYFRPGLNFLTAFPFRAAFIGYDPDDTTSLVFSDSKWYGLEYDIDLNIDHNETLHYGISWGHFFPGGVYNDQQDIVSPVAGEANQAENVWTLQWRLLVSF